MGWRFLCAQKFTAGGEFSQETWRFVAGSEKAAASESGRYKGKRNPGEKPQGSRNRPALQRANPGVKMRKSGALGRKSPPFVKGAKDGAPSCSLVCGVTRETQDPGRR